MLGVIFGVAFFILTQAQTQGFERYFIKTILGTSGAITIADRFQARYTGFDNTEGADFVATSGQKRRKYYDGITDANEIMRITRQFSNVIACAPVVQGNMAVYNDFQSEIVQLQGIQLADHLKVTALRDQIIAGNLDDFRTNPNTIILGSLLAEKLQVNAGESVRMTDADGESRTYNVAALARSGVNAVDEKRAYVDLRTAQRLLDKPQQVSSIIISLRDPDRAPALATHLEKLFTHRARAWQDRERGNLQVFTTLRLSAGITVSLIILLAGFGIFNILTMSVLDKVREIAILRSMGYRRADISAMFLWQGIVIATAGSLLGAGFGALLTYGVSNIPIKVRGILYTDSFIVHWSLSHYIFASCIAFVSVLIASYFPARRAANLPPVDTLRGSGQ